MIQGGAIIAGGAEVDNIPRSLMFMTPLFFFSFGASVMAAAMLKLKLRAGLRGSQLGLCNGVSGTGASRPTGIDMTSRRGEKCSFG